MIKVDWPLFLKRLGYFLGFLLGVFLIQTYINNTVSTYSQKIEEVCEADKAAIKLELEQKLSDEKTRLEKEIIEYKTQLEKAKILIEKMETQKSYSELIKKDVKKFIQEFDELFGVKGK